MTRESHTSYFLRLVGLWKVCLLPPARTVWNFMASVLSIVQGESIYIEEGVKRKKCQNADRPEHKMEIPHLYTNTAKGKGNN